MRGSPQPCLYLDVEKNKRLLLGGAWTWRLWSGRKGVGQPAFWLSHLFNIWVLVNFICDLPVRCSYNGSYPSLASGWYSLTGCYALTFWYALTEAREKGSEKQASRVASLLHFWGGVCRVVRTGIVNSNVCSPSNILIAPAHQLDHGTIHNGQSSSLSSEASSMELLYSTSIINDISNTRSFNGGIQGICRNHRIWKRKGT